MKKLRVSPSRAFDVLILAPFLAYQGTFIQQKETRYIAFAFAFYVFIGHLFMIYVNLVDKEFPPITVRTPSDIEKSLLMKFLTIFTSVPIMVYINVSASGSQPPFASFLGWFFAGLTLVYNLYFTSRLLSGGPEATATSSTLG